MAYDFAESPLWSAFLSFPSVNLGDLRGKPSLIRQSDNAILQSSDFEVDQQADLIAAEFQI